MTTLQQTTPPAVLPAGGGQPAPRRRRMATTSWIGVLFVLPATLYVLVYQLVPVLYGLLLSLTEYSPLSRSGPRFVGLSNYAALLDDRGFAQALLVTGQYVLLVLPPTVVVALVLAMLADRPFRGVGFFRSALYVPHIVSLTTVAVVWLWIYSPNGLVNEALTGLGLGPQSWLLDEDAAMPAVAAMRVWKALGSNMVLLLAGLQSIPRELYEAASTDGASPWQRFRHITLPGLRPILTYVVAMDIIFLAQGFAELFILTGGGPLGRTTTVNYLIYTEAFQYNSFGSASAMAFVLFAFIAAFSFVSIRGIAGRR
ncbi:carbohydrate ABC transporter permease [Auraticoccus monumenti]|uniref:Carbohydrate ABC transporter membrane protein 1, CUT1 family n=1 Tax=Auraticoccus monumenti TaxID=675864 RepID=A0A1G7D2Y1_9ACTN|nr:sugar ABC transporter permease [Auraticoccus monumenti]SDE45326.1 carbohydrate ABC transporter membrane protein 1, CUT1 family [Auraticoccus monumenti]